VKRSFHCSQIYPSSFNGEPYFTISKRLSRDGKFTGVPEISVLPSNFFKFFGLGLHPWLAICPHSSRRPFPCPEVPAASANQLGPQTGFRRTVDQFLAGGYYNSTSPVDGIDRRYAIRRLDNTPLYLTAGIENATPVRISRSPD
jgi:two-component system, NtrC family, sensor kinase